MRVLGRRRPEDVVLGGWLLDGEDLFAGGPDLDDPFQFTDDLGTFLRAELENSFACRRTPGKKENEQLKKKYSGISSAPNFSVIWRKMFWGCRSKLVSTHLPTSSDTMVVFVLTVVPVDSCKYCLMWATGHTTKHEAMPGFARPTPWLNTASCRSPLIPRRWEDSVGWTDTWKISRANDTAKENLTKYQQFNAEICP